MLNVRSHLVDVLMLHKHLGLATGGSAWLHGLEGERWEERRLWPGANFLLFPH